VITEPIQGTAGYIIPPPDFYQMLKELCEENGWMFIADEIQSGLGRSGKMFAIEHWNVVPDIVCVAKALAGGIAPIGAMIADAKVMNWEPGAHASTFGGNLVACAAAVEGLGKVADTSTMLDRLRIALADDESRIAALFQHRFREGSFNGHSLGNLVIAGLQERTGRFDLAIAEMSHILNIRGQVLPATLEQVDLIAEMEDGEFVRGEEEIARDARKIKKIFLSKRPVRPYEQILEEISQAEVIVLGPGSLFTSIIPNLLVEDVAQEIERASATKFYIVNLMTQPGETDGFTAGDHLRVLGEYIDISKLDYIVINSQPVPEPLLRQYEADHAVPVVNDLEPMDLDLGPEGSKPKLKLKSKPKVITADLLEIVELEGKPTVKHNSKRLAELIMEEVRERSQRPRAITKRRIL